MLALVTVGVSSIYEKENDIYVGWEQNARQNGDDREDFNFHHCPQEMDYELLLRQSATMKSVYLCIWHEVGIGRCLVCMYYVFGCKKQK